MPRARSSSTRRAARSRRSLELAELNRLRRARRRARRLQARLLAVVAERALERAPVVGPPIDDAERAGDDAVAAAVADVGLDEDAAELGADDRSGRARLEAAGVLAVLADVGREIPPERIAPVAAVGGRAPAVAALDELDVPPGRVAEAAGVVVREARCSAKPSSGTSFHSLHATSQALQPMQSVESVRKAVVGHAVPAPSTSARRQRPSTSMIRTFGSSEIATRSLTTSPRDEAAAAEVIRQADLVNDAAVDRRAAHARRDERARLDRAARRRRRVTHVAVRDADLAAPARARSRRRAPAAARRDATACATCRRPCDVRSAGRS